MPHADEPIRLLGAGARWARVAVLVPTDVRSGLADVLSAAGKLGGIAGAGPVD